MRQSSANDLFLNSSFPAIDVHQFQPFDRGHIDVKMPAPNTDIRLFIFNPVDYPYLWVKYLAGLKREYSRMNVSHILDMNSLNDPASTDMAMLAIINGEIISGLRFHARLKRAEDATVYKEMAGGNLPLLSKYLERWIPENVIEPKGLWINSPSGARKRVLHLMARCGVYGAALMDCRYSICTSPKSITRIHINIGMQAMEEIGCVNYPTEDYQTTFGCVDLHQVLDLCDEQNSVLLRREWQYIHFSRLKPIGGSGITESWRPLILDEGNPFHSQALESLLLDDQYTQHKTYKSMQAELNELLPDVSDELKAETKRWVVYPWKKSVIEILGPKSFKKLRTDRNRNKITDEEQRKLALLNVGVVGLSTGHVIAHTLIMEGACGSLKLADFDELEVSNLNRIPASLLDVGLNKAVLTARRIAELDPYLHIDVFDEGVTPSNIEDFMRGLDVVIEECDSLDVKVLVREAAIKHKIPVLMATSDRGMMDVERFDIDENPMPFHGLADVSASKLKDLSLRDKSGYALAIVDGEQISPRLAASMFEIDHTVKTWSQLASDVTQGAAMVVTAVRRLGTEQALPSSRIRMDIDQCFAEGEKPRARSSHDLTEVSNPKFSGNLKDDISLAAEFAPSPGNIQPWNFYWEGHSFHLEINRALTTSMDVAWRGAMAALGAACFNAEVVAAYYGQSINVDEFPTPQNIDLVALISVRDEKNVESKLKSLYPHLLTRVTNRELTKRKRIPFDVMSKLAEVTKQFPIKLHSLSTQQQLNDYAEIAVGSDRLRHLSKHLHQQMTSELVWPGTDSLETGIDVRTLGLEDKDLNVLPIIGRRDVMDELADWEGGEALGDYNKERIINAAAMVVITIKGQSEADYFAGGKALQHFWLVAETCGLVIQPVSPVFLYANSDAEMSELMNGEYLEEVTLLKKRFNELLHIQEGEYPVLVLRVAYAPEAKFRSLRRTNG